MGCICMALAPLGLMHEGMWQPTLAKHYKGRVKQALLYDEPLKCPPWDGICGNIQHGSTLHYMLMIWLLTGTRFSTICKLRISHLDTAILEGEPNLIITFWDDKILQKRGRQVATGCCCSSKLEQGQQWCPVCFTVDREDLSNMMSSEGWDQLQKLLDCRMHSMRRRIAIEIMKHNKKEKSGKNVILLVEINLFIGWAETSKMFDSYVVDFEKVRKYDFPIPLEGLLKSIRRTVLLETKGVGVNRAGVRLRLEIEAANNSMVEAIKYNEHVSQFGQEME